MPEIKNILVPTDFSKAAYDALEVVSRITADSTVKKVTFLHASNKEKKQEVEFQKLTRQFEVISSTPYRIKIVRGALDDTLLNEQKSGEYDLVIMGTKGSQKEEDDTNTSSFVLRSDAPTLVAPEGVSSSGINNIALAIDLETIDDTTALAPLHSIAMEHRAKVHVLTIDNNEDKAVSEDHSMERVLDYYLETLDFHHSFPKNSDIEMGIAEYIKKHQIDILAILPRTHAKKTQPSEGRLTKLLTLRSKVPVLALD